MGGGFGAKQEMLVEDIVALAVLKTGRPVKLEFTREEQFIGATTRHPMRVRIKAGARRDGRLTAMQMHVVSNTGAYGNHGRPCSITPAANASASTTAPTKRSTALRSIPTPCRPAPSAATACRRPISPWNRRWTSWRASSAWIRSSFASATSCSPGDPMISTGSEDGPRRRIWQLRPRSMPRLGRMTRLDRGGGLPPPSSDDWLVGQGMALGMIDTVPPFGHFADASVALRDDGSLRAHRRHRRVRQRHATVHRQIAATVLGTTVDKHPGARIRYRPWRPRHRRLWQHRHGRRRTRHAARLRSLARRNSALLPPSMPAASRRRGRSIAGAG